MTIACLLKFKMRRIPFLISEFLILKNPLIYIGLLLDKCYSAGLWFPDKGDCHKVNNMESKMPPTKKIRYGNNCKTAADAFAFAAHFSLYKKYI